MRKILFTCLLILIGVLVFIDFSRAQNSSQPIRKQIPKISMDSEANVAYPFGRLNPKAPPETKQFDFIVGEFDCDDQILNRQNGKFFKMKAIRKAEYVLDGFAIQDKNWTPLFNATNIRVYNPQTKEWTVTYFRTPNFVTGVWKGKKEGKNMVLKQGNDENSSRLTFFNISKGGYSWKSERTTDGNTVLNWQFTCKRRR